MIDDSEIEQPVTAAPASDWAAGLDPDLGAFVAQKGWRSLGDALGSYRHLERLMGAERLALPAADADDAAWAPVWDRLGRPPAAGGYEFVAPEDKPYDPATADWFRTLAHRIGLTQRQAREIHDGFLAQLLVPAAEGPQDAGPVAAGKAAVDGAAVDGAAAEEAAAEESPMAALREAWGRHYDSNMASARRAYAALLESEAPFHDIADAMGETALMQLLAKAGRHIAEDSITARADGAPGPRNPAEALAEIAKLQRAAGADAGHPYLSKTHPEHQTLVKRMEALYALAYGG
jgi:hypothetical protein